MSNSTSTLVRDAARRLAAAGCPSAELDASLLLAHVLDVERFRLALDPDRVVSTDDLARFEVLVTERLRRRPVGQLVGSVEFWSLPFAVTKDVLSPRPETEMLVECAAAHLRGCAEPVAVDVGTGSGCIAVAIAVEVPNTIVHATDTSAAALAVAARNIAAHSVGERVRLTRGDLLEPLSRADVEVDVVVSNPPYVRRSEGGRVDPEVLWEPARAVFCDGEPAPLYERIARDAAPLVRDGGLLLLELPGEREQPIVEAIAALDEWREVSVAADLAGLPRVLSARRLSATRALRTPHG